MRECAVKFLIVPRFHLFNSGIRHSPRSLHQYATAESLSHPEEFRVFIVHLLSRLQIPESPIWLLSQGKNKKAMDAICWLRGWVDPSDVAFEYQQLMFYYKTSLEQMMADKSSRLTGVSSTLACLKSPSVYRPLRLATVYYLITLISCLTPCRPYIVKLMYDAGVKDTHSIALVSITVV